MIVLKMNENKQLKKITQTSIYNGEVGESVLLYLPQYYNGCSLGDFEVELHWVCGNKLGDIIPATKQNELKTSHIEYNIPIPRKMTEYIGDITVWIEVIGNEGVLIKSDTVSISITEHLKVSEYLTDSQLSLIDMNLVQMNQYRTEFESIKNEIKEILDNAIQVGKLVAKMCEEVDGD